MERTTRNTVYLIIAALIVVGSAAVALQAYAHGQEAYRQGGEDYGPMGMGGMMGQSGMMPIQSYYEDDHDDYIGHCSGMEYMEKNMEEYAENFYNGIPVTINGTVVGAVNEKNILIVKTNENDTVLVVIQPMYIDEDNGYMLSGFWLVDQITNMVSQGNTVNITINGLYNGDRGVTIASTLHVLGKDLTGPMNYIHSDETP